ncbi:MAG TPA: hypothetical protein VHT51_15580 [Micropepsaceae bacterium]|nr:hypothetical protein [Micropepsaceae bacterium]
MDPQWIEAGAAAVTGLFTIVLGVSTIGLWRQTARLARGTDQALRLANQEFLSTHRPKIEIRWMSLQPGRKDFPVSVKFHIVNKGQTAATIIGIKGAVFPVVAEFACPGGNPIGDPANMPWSDYRKIQEGISRPFSHKLQSGEIIDFTIEADDGEIFRKQDAETHAIICAGEIMYWDDMKLCRRTGFSRCHYPDGGQFIQAVNSDYEYVD